MLGPDKIPKLEGLEGYSNFCMREMVNHVKTPHVLVVQADGYVLNAEAWTDEFLKYDYIGAPWLPSNAVGNGGFSLRSKRLLEALTKLPTTYDHPEDTAICLYHRAELEKQGMKFAPVELARKFSFEGRSWNNTDWDGISKSWNGEFGFHSWLTPVSGHNWPKIFHHSGERGDVIYSLPVIKALGGGVLFVSPDNRHPWPKPCRERPNPDWNESLAPLLEAQDYIWRVQLTTGLPFSVDYDLNRFRVPWKKRSSKDFESIFNLHQQAFAVKWPEHEPWLTVPHAIEIPRRPIVVSRSSRYQNDSFPWDRLCERYGDRMIFVGNPTEASVFKGFAPRHDILHCPTANLLEAAAVIAGAKVFIGNQSAPLAIAHGLCKNVIVEEWAENPNCRINRDGAIYSLTRSPDQLEEIPASWL